MKILFLSLEIGKGSQKMSKSLCMASKRAGQPQVMAAVAGLKDCLLFVLDKMTERCFLVDTGTEVSEGLESRIVKTGPALLATNGSKIKSFGTRKLTLHFNSGTYHWGFVVAQVNKPLLGADLLRANKLLVDMANKQLVDASTYCTSPLKRTYMLAPHLGTIAHPVNQYKVLLSKYSSVITTQFHQHSCKHGVEHFIITHGPPVFAKARWLPPDKLKVAKKEFFNMVSLGIIRPSFSPWASPLHMVPKLQVGGNPVVIIGGSTKSCSQIGTLSPIYRTFQHTCLGKPFFQRWIGSGVTIRSGMLLKHSRG